MSNIALSALDQRYTRAWEAMGDTTARAKRRRHGEANYRLVRYADDFVVCVAGDRRHTEALVAETERVIRPLGLALSPEKTRVTHIDEGIEFLGWRIKRQQGRDGRPHVYTYPSARSLAAVKGGEGDQAVGLQPAARPAPAPAQPGAQGLVRLLPKRGLLAHLQLPACLHLAAGRSLAAPETPQGKLALAAAPLPPRWWPTDGTTVLFNPGGVRTTRYRYRGKNIPTPWEQDVLACASPPCRSSAWKD